MPINYNGAWTVGTEGKHGHFGGLCQHGEQCDSLRTLETGGLLDVIVVALVCLYLLIFVCVYVSEGSKWR